MGVAATAIGVRKIAAGGCGEIAAVEIPLAGDLSLDGRDAEEARESCTEKAEVACFVHGM